MHLPSANEDRAKNYLAKFLVCYEFYARGGSKIEYWSLRYYGSRKIILFQNVSIYQHVVPQINLVVLMFWTNLREIMKSTSCADYIHGYTREVLALEYE